MSSPPPEPTDLPETDRSDDAGQTDPGPSEATLGRARQRLRQVEPLVHLGIFVHRRLPSETASAVLVRKALRIVFQVMVEVLDTEAPATNDWTALRDQAAKLNHDHRWSRHPVHEHYALVDRLAEGFDPIDFKTTAADQRQYRKVLRRLPSLLHDALARVDKQRRCLPGVRQRRRRRWLVGLLTAGTVLAAVGTYGYVRAARCITGQYFAGRGHEHLVAERRDCVVDFDWGARPPIEGLGADDFSVRWEGLLAIDSPGLYTFELTSDDGSRLFVDGKLLIDHWADHGFLPQQATIRLEEGRKPFRVEFYEREGLAAIQLSWRRDGGPTELVPRQVMLSP